MESECIKGEGLNFYFPEEKCSPFPEQRQSTFVNLRNACAWRYCNVIDYMVLITPSQVLASTKVVRIQPQVHYSEKQCY